MTCGLEKLGRIDHTDLECDLSALLLRALAVGRGQQSTEWIGFAPEME